MGETRRRRRRRRFRTRSSRCGRRSAPACSSPARRDTRSRSSASSSTRITSNGCSRTRDVRRPRSGARSSSARSSCGAGLHSPSSRSRTGPRPRTRRLEELRLVALEERIATDIELGHPADVVSELDSLVVEHPLRERLWYLLMSARHEAGRSAEALQAYTDARAHLTSSASSRARRSAASRARSCAVRRPGRVARTAMAPIATPTRRS